MTRSSLTAVASFVKYPLRGKVKTRIAAVLGEDLALRIYDALLRYTLRLVSALPADAFSPYIYADPFCAQHEYEKLFAAPAVKVEMQRGDDLGQRLSHCVEELTAKYESVIVIGSDCSELQRIHLEQARRALTECDVVLGPTEDGGYYLIGMKRFHPELFDCIEWSTASVCRQTMERAQKADLSVSVLSSLRDIDTAEDWHRVQSSLEI